MNRLLFEKTGDAVYLSHLDLMRIFQRAFQRADILIWHSQGFRPRAYVSIALPLSVGAESRCEILDFDITDGGVDTRTLPERLNKTMPDGIRVLAAYESEVKIKHLNKLEANVTLEYDGGIPGGCKDKLQELFARESLVIHKKTKRGEADVDIRPMLFGLEISRLSGQELCLHTLVSAQNPSLNPQLLVTAIETYLPECKPDFSAVHRLEVYDEAGNLFR